MEETWKASEFTSLVSSRHGVGHLESAGAADASIGWKVWMADYHADQAAKLESEHLPNAVAATHNMLLSAANQPEAGPYRLALFRAEAHIIACAQSLHSLGDIMANVIFTASGLAGETLIEHRRSLYNVIKLLEGAPEMCAIVQPLRALRESRDFRYLQAFVNITKHRSLVRTYPRVSFMPETRQGLMIDAFDYRDESFVERWASELYLDSRVEVVKGIVKCGIAANHWLAGDAA